MYWHSTWHSVVVETLSRFANANRQFTNTESTFIIWQHGLQVCLFLTNEFTCLEEVTFADKISYTNHPD